MPIHSKNRCPPCDCLNKLVDTESGNDMCMDTLETFCECSPCFYVVNWECPYQTLNGEMITTAKDIVRRDCPLSATWSSRWSRTANGRSAPILSCEGCNDFQRKVGAPLNCTPEIPCPGIPSLSGFVPMFFDPGGTWEYQTYGFGVFALFCFTRECALGGGINSGGDVHGIRCLFGYGSYNGAVPQSSCNWFCHPGACSLDDPNSISPSVDFHMTPDGQCTMRVGGGMRQSFSGALSTYWMIRYHGQWSCETQSVQMQFAYFEEGEDDFHNGTPPFTPFNYSEDYLVNCHNEIPEASVGNCLALESRQRLEAAMLSGFTLYATNACPDDYGGIVDGGSGVTIDEAGVYAGSCIWTREYRTFFQKQVLTQTDATTAYLDVTAENYDQSAQYICTTFNCQGRSHFRLLRRDPDLLTLPEHVCVDAFYQTVYPNCSQETFDDGNATKQVNLGGDTFTTGIYSNCLEAEILPAGTYFFTRGLTNVPDSVLAGMGISPETIERNPPIPYFCRYFWYQFSHATGCDKYPGNYILVLRYARTLDEFPDAINADDDDIEIMGHLFCYSAEEETWESVFHQSVSSLIEPCLALLDDTDRISVGGFAVDGCCCPDGVPCDACEGFPIPLNLTAEIIGGSCGGGATELVWNGEAWTGSFNPVAVAILVCNGSEWSLGIDEGVVCPGSLSSAECDGLELVFDFSDCSLCESGAFQVRITAAE